ncbi:uncharacterized protein TRIADDRAFT_58071 [Trichoplax adhaerens]|uniref:XK-related protein n=1 Tax=Trichoplax adhaerens TaxID=10228 RepID=B3S2L8_TRIAD|nr:hypothetical protein TRIADDRAFT_58071 [Trichoplax adhaerens]EDV23118.1 hypothetical protein TRIADDRAFT_58071 [Trichoplax adhaerens]|eukprot:XP_002114028.1 hypothetical protein TRIADDRAFT_58071 [Trichoplax adhaerens]
MINILKSKKATNKSADQEGKSNQQNQQQKSEETNHSNDNPNRDLCVKSLSLPVEFIARNRSQLEYGLERKFRWSKKRCLFYILSEIIFIANFTTDIVVGIDYISYGSTSWGWTIIILAIACLLFQQLFSLIWSIKLCSKDGENNNAGVPNENVSNHRSWNACQTGFKHLFCLSRLYRYIHLIHRGRKEHNRREDTLIVFELLETTVLDVIEAAVTSAPQLTIQCYLMIELSEVSVLRVISVIISAVEISYAIAHHARILRESESQLRPTANTLSKSGYFVYTMWRFCTVASRMIFLGICAYTIGIYIFVMFACHWITVAIISLWDGAGNYFASPIRKYTFCILLGYIDNFFFLNVKQGRTRMRYLVHFFLLFVELTSVVLYCLLTNKISRPVVLPVLLTALLFYVIGAAFMITYYCCAHPTKDRLSTYLMQPRLPKSATRQSIQLYYSQANSRNPTPNIQRRGNVLSQPGSRRHSITDNIDNATGNLPVFRKSITELGSQREGESNQFLHPNKAAIIFADRLAKLNHDTIEEESAIEQTVSITISTDSYSKPNEVSNGELDMAEVFSTNSRSSHEDDEDIAASDSGIAISSGGNSYLYRTDMVSQSKSVQQTITLEETNGNIAMITSSKKSGSTDKSIAVIDKGSSNKILKYRTTTL